MSSSARTAAIVTMLVLLVVLVALAVWQTPWRVLPSAPGGAVTPDAARDFTAEQIARADAYRSAIRLPSYLSLAIGLVVSVALGLSPLGARLIGWAARPLGGGWWATVLVGGFAVLLVGLLVSLPFSAWAEVVRTDYGLSTRTWAGWASDVLRGFGLQAGLTLVVLVAVYALIRWLPSWWWTIGAALAAALVVVLSFLYPVLVEPVFNRFASMPDGELRTSLLELAERDGVPVDDVLIADASRRTTALNAYVSGIGATRRIVVYDTLLADASPDEVCSVVAHELGHAKENDVVWGTAMGAVAAGAGVCAIALALASPGLLRRAGVTAAGDPRSLALLLAVVAVVSVAAGPVANLLSRRIEARADLHALKLTRDPASFVGLQQRLGLRNLSDLDPNPVIYVLFATHPSTTERIAFARTWAAAEGVPAP